MRFKEIYTHLNEHIELVFEGAAEEIIPDLKALGFLNFRRQNSKRVVAFVPRKDRQAVLQQLANRLPDAEYDKNVQGSSVGAIRYKGGTIFVKPEGGTGSQSAGLANEKQLIDKVNEFVAENGSLDVIFKGANGKEISASGVTQAIAVGLDSKNRKKSDVQLVAGSKKIPISIKKSNAEYWESADTMWGKQADELIDNLSARGEVDLIEIDKTRKDGVQFVKIKPEIAKKATPEETVDVVFGSDILKGNGAVVKQTFTNEDYKLEGNILYIEADAVILSPDDIPDNQIVYWLIRNDSTRFRPNHKYPGLRVLASYASRINKNTKVVD